jgi:hypothetical protein
MTKLFLPKEPFTNLKVKGQGKFTIENLMINRFDFK